MEEPCGAEIDPAEELPVALQFRRQHAVERLVRETLQQVCAGRASGTPAAPSAGRGPTASG